MSVHRLQVGITHHAPLPPAPTAAREPTFTETGDPVPLCCCDVEGGKFDFM